MILPSISIRDGKTELRDSEADAIGSVVNYLLTHGWKKLLPYVFPASLHILESATENKSKSQLHD